MFLFTCLFSFVYWFAAQIRSRQHHPYGHFFCKNNFIRTRGSFLLKILRTISASAAQLAKCILLHASARTTVAPSCASAQEQAKISYCLLNKLEYFW